MRNREEMHALVVEKAQRRLRRQRVVRSGAGAAVVLALVAITFAVSRPTPHAQTVTVDQPSSTTSMTTSTTAPTTTATAPSSAQPTPALYPTYLPAVDLSGTLQISHFDPRTPDHIQSYYATGNSGTGSCCTRLPQLLIEESTNGLGGTHAPAMLGGQPVELWTITPDEEVLGVTSVVDDAPVTLIGVHLSRDDLGAILSSIQRRTDRRGWTTGNLPAGLVLVGDVDETEASTSYDLSFATPSTPPGTSPSIKVRVTDGGLRPEDACYCNAGQRTSMWLDNVVNRPTVVIDFTGVDGSGGPSYVLEWQQSPAAWVSVVVQGFSRDEAYRIAVSIAPADAAAWNSLPCAVNVRGQNGLVPCNPGDEIPTG